MTNFVSPQICGFAISGTYWQIFCIILVIGSDFKEEGRNFIVSFLSKKATKNIFKIISVHKESLDLALKTFKQSSCNIIPLGQKSCLSCCIKMKCIIFSKLTIPSNEKKEWQEPASLWSSLACQPHFWFAVVFALQTNPSSLDSL